MNIKSISIFVMSLLFCVSCIDEEMTKQCDAGLTLSFTTNAVITKADIANGYSYTSDDESKINQVYLAFYDGNTLLALESRTFTAPTGTLADNRPYYQISNLEAYLFL